MKVLNILALLFVAADAATGGTIARYDALDVDARPIVATGLELRGEADGGRVSDWDTSTTADGWVSVSSGDTTARVLVLNTPAVVGGRLTEDETWTSDRIRVVRDDIIVPSGVTLTLEVGAIVKFLPEARLLVEDGGVLVSKGAHLVDFANDAVGGDTNMDGSETLALDVEWWRDDPVVGKQITVEFLDGARAVAPSRVYTSGIALGDLPQPEMDGAKFIGWFSAPEGAGVPITSLTRAEGNLTAYAFWQPLSLAIEPSTVSVSPDESSGSFMVSANGAWSAVVISKDDNWLSLRTSFGEGNGEVLFSVAANETLTYRSGTIRISLKDGTFCDFTVTQGATQAVMKPTINPADGTTFSSARQRVSMSCATRGAIIHYTLDGTDPDESSPSYAGTSFNVFDTVTVKARAYAEGMKPSEISSATLVRLQTLQEAIDQPLWPVTTGGDNQWEVDATTTSDGKSSARSGKIGDGEESWLETKVEGAGTLSFRWKVVCEDDPDGEGWDFLAFSIDDMFVEAIDGDSGWQRVSVKVKDGGVHTFQWLFCKDYFDDAECDDIAWVDQVTWTPTVTDMDIPVSWIESLGVRSSVGSAEDAANSDPDGDGFTTAEEYVMGTDPYDAESKLTASIEVIDGKPVIKYAPDMKEKRNYTVWGRRSLSDPNERWEPVAEGRESDYYFFKVSVEQP